MLPRSLAERVGETVGREEERGILACQQGPLLRKLPEGESWGQGPLACEQGPLLPGFSLGGGWGEGAVRDLARRLELGRVLLLSIMFFS